MSGSSLDGIDVVICSFEEDLKFNLLKCEEIKIPPEIGSFLADPLKESSRNYLEKAADFSLWLALQLKEIIKSAEVPIDLISCHGHTILHDPKRKFTEQIGNGGLISSITGVDTLCDLRIQDIGYGGQGAPLASLYDQYLFSQYDLMLNLGGIANVSIRQEDKILAWDICPCNQILNHFSQLAGMPYDDKGKLASIGVSDKNQVVQLKKLAYFDQPPPKSIDNYWVKEEFLYLFNKDLGVNDSLATMVDFVAEQVAEDIREKTLKKDEKLSMAITGGGAHNDYLVKCIQRCLKPLGIQCIIPHSTIINYKEAILMAFMGHRYLAGQKNTLSSATGADRNLIAGAFYKGHG